MLYYTILYYAILCYTMLYYAILCYSAIKFALNRKFNNSPSGTRPEIFLMEIIK